MTIQTLYKIISEYYNCEFKLLHTRKREIADKKKIFVYIAKQNTNATFQQLAEFLGYDNHSTAIAAYRSFEILKSVYSTFQEDLNNIEKIIQTESDFIECVGQLRDRNR